MGYINEKKGNYFLVEKADDNENKDIYRTQLLHNLERKHKNQFEKLRAYTSTI